MLLCCLLQATAGHARDPLHESRPFDTVVLQNADGEISYETIPLDLPSGRRLPRPLPRSGRLVFQLLDTPGQDVEAPWSTITRVVLFEQRLLNEANRSVATGDFDSAYVLFARLDNEYPRLAGLEKALEGFLKKEALSRFREGDNLGAIVLLQSLYERIPAAQGLAQAVDAVANKTLQQQWDNRDYTGLVATIGAVRSQFEGLALSINQQWSSRLAQAADGLRQEARQLAASGDFRGALRMVDEIDRIDPGATANARLRDEIRQANPALWVGVFETAEPGLRVRIDRPATRRASWLLESELVRLEDYGPTGGEYGSPLGELTSDDSRRSIQLSPTQGGATAHEIARNLLEASNGPSAPIVAAYADKLEVRSQDALVVSLQRQHPNPASLLMGPIPEGLSFEATWRIKDHSPDRVTYERSKRGAGAFSTIEEIRYADDRSAINALIAGEIDMLASVPPWRVERLESVRGVSVGRLRVPELHCLMFGEGSLLAESREVRRALLYAIARESILNELILAGAPLEGFETITAALPQGLNLGDPMRYAYNDGVLLRPYEPRLAALLMNSRGSEEDAPEAPSEYVLIHSRTPVARLACEAIRKQLLQVGITLELQEVSEQELTSGQTPHDLRYVEISIREPMVDIRRLFGAGGLLSDTSASMELALNRLRLATSGQEVAKALREIHRISYTETPMLPLWQTVEHFAYRNDLQGVPAMTAGLYQTIDSWRPAGGGGRP